MAKLTLEQRVARIENHIKTGSPLEVPEDAVVVAPTPASIPVEDNASEV